MTNFGFTKIFVFRNKVCILPLGGVPTYSFFQTATRRLILRYASRAKSKLKIMHHWKNGMHHTRTSLFSNEQWGIHPKCARALPIRRCTQNYKSSRNNVLVHFKFLGSQQLDFVTLQTAGSVRYVRVGRDSSEPAFSHVRNVLVP